MTGKRILVVDDERFVADGVKMVLELDDHEVELSFDALQALRQYVPGKYDLVLTDNCLPGMTGLELAKTIKALNPKQPIMLLTGFPPSVPPPSVDLVLRKPFSGDELLWAVAKLTTPPAGRV